MSTTKIAITIDKGILNRLDYLVSERKYPSRSRAIQEAVGEKLDRLEQSRLAEECAKLDPAFEVMLAEEGMERELAEWPEY